MQFLSRKLLLIVLALSFTVVVLTILPRSTTFFKYGRSIIQENSLSSQHGNLPSSIENHSMLGVISARRSANNTQGTKELIQQVEVDKLCKRLKYPGSYMVLDRQMLVSDEDRVAFCYVPKAGCTTLKTLLFLKLGAISPFAIRDKSAHPNEGLLELAIQKHSFMAKNEHEKQEIIKNYYKFIMYRNPVERLVSGYLSKVRGYPLIGLQPSLPERNWLRHDIYKRTHPSEYKRWVGSGANVSITISFPDFVKHWIATGGLKIDEHFETIYDLCSPCQVRYSYYGNFNSFEKEVGVFNDRIHGNMDQLLYAEKRSDGPTFSSTPKYYSQITNQQKKKIIEILSTDLLFYYTLFPAEKDSHKAIMGVDYDISLPY